MSAAPLVALVSATAAAVPPAVEGLRAALPGAVVWNLLDDRLMQEADARGGVTGPLVGRMHRLIDHARAEGADGVLLTCSVYGEVAHAASSPELPVLAADDGAFAAAIGGGHRRVLVVASSGTALADTTARFGRAAGPDVAVSGAVAPGALAAGGDSAALLAALTGAVAPRAAATDAVLLAQYSLAPVAAELERAVGRPVVAGPAAAARLLATRLAARP